MVWNDDNLFRVPDLCVFAKLLFKYAKGARATDIMCQQLVYFCPDVGARLNSGVARVLSQNLFSEGHSMFDLHRKLSCNSLLCVNNGDMLANTRTRDYTPPVAAGLRLVLGAAGA